MHSFPSSASILALTLMIAACDRSPPADVSRPSALNPSASTGHAAAEAPRSGPAGIDWHDGGVDGAFAAANASDKPVLLYWGAVWCPYCADLEAHVLSRDDVRSKLELFVPIYIDGDAPGAQRWGDRFGVAGYPTMLALAPDGTELARIAGGMDLTLYAEMLDFVLADLRPIEDVLRASERGRLTADDCRRLAYNGWGLDDAASHEGTSLGERLAIAAQQCAMGSGVEEARLVVHAASFAVSGGEMDAQRTAPLVRRVREIVANRELATSVVDVLRGLREDYFLAARNLEPEHRERLLSDWVAVMDAASEDPRYGHGDRLAAMRSKVEAVDALSADGVPSALAAEARRRIDSALGEVGRSAARRGAVNSAINLLIALDDFERAREIAVGELESSRTPYYSMGDIAWLDEQLGRYGDAVEWLRRAYEASNGPATRFQWGTNYVRGLIRMTPEDEAAIREAALDVLGELDGPNRIYRRSRARLEALDAAFGDWSRTGDRDTTIAALRRRMSEICTRIPADETDALASCTAFLASGPAALP